MFEQLDLFNPRPEVEKTPKYRWYFLRDWIPKIGDKFQVDVVCANLLNPINEGGRLRERIYAYMCRGRLTGKTNEGFWIAKINHSEYGTCEIVLTDDELWPCMY